MEKKKYDENLLISRNILNSLENTNRIPKLLEIVDKYVDDYTHIDINTYDETYWSQKYPLHPKKLHEFLAKCNKEKNYDNYDIFKIEKNKNIIINSDL